MPNPVTRRDFIATTAAGLALCATGPARSQEEGGPATLAENGHSNCVIVLPQDPSPSQAYAAEELQRFIGEMTDAMLPIVGDDVPLPGRAILLGRTRHTAAVLGEEPDLESLGADGFRLCARGGRICVVGGPVRGTLYGAYELLERYCGCRWYASFYSVIPRHTTLTVPEVDDTQTPAFAMREPYWYEMRDGDFAARNRANGNSMALEEKHGGKIRFGGGLFVHTFYGLVPPDEFFEEHPEYFSLIDGERRIGYSQLCTTNPDVLRIVTERVLERIRRDPEGKLFSVSQNDWDGHCQCENCMAIEEREESPAGPLIDFVNKVAEAVEQEFPDVWIETLAYQYTRKPPKTIRPRHNVVPRLCTIECDFSLPLDVSSYPQNTRFVEDIQGWSAMTDKLYVWDYTTNFHNYVGPHPNFPAIPGNIRFFRDNRVVGLFEQGACEGPHAEFGELRGWLIAKLLWDPDQPVERLLDDFFAGYYGPAAGPVREYFDELQTLAIAPEVPVRIFDSLRNPWLTMEFIERAEALWAEAERLAADDADLLYRVRMSGIPVYWARVKLMDAPEPVFTLRDGRMVHRSVDPQYLAAGTELLRRVAEGNVRVREYNGYHTQEIMDITGHVEGYPLTTVEADGVTIGAAAARGGAAVLWSDNGGPNLLSPESGGLEVVNRQSGLRTPGMTEFEVVEAAEGVITLRAAAPRAIWGPQSVERLAVERSMRVVSDGVSLTETYTLERQSREVTPAIRVALAMKGPVAIRADAYEATVGGPDTDGAESLSLPEEALASRAFEFAASDGSGAVRVELSEACEQVTMTLEEERGAVLFAGVLPKSEVSPGTPRVVTVTARRSGP